MVNQHALIARANTNLKESNSELARLNQQMRELDQMKTRFSPMSATNCVRR